MKIKKYLHKLWCGILLCASLASPMTAFATEETDPAATAVLEAYNKPIESNSWENWPAGPSVYAQSAIVMEASTGMILYAKDVETTNYPASITKIMTALLALENCDLQDNVEFSYYATHSIEYGSSSIARTEGEILTVEEALYGLMLSSANECANALAEHIAGSNEAFAELMNEKAAQLGCVNTHFANPSGLHDENHYTCAYDMALITRAAIANEDFRRIAGTNYYTLRATNKNSEELWMQNHHNMIAPYKTTKFLDETVFAGKTGYTTDALNTLVTCGTRNDMDVIVVTMRTQSTGERGVPLYTDTAALLDYANNFQKFNISENEKTFQVGNAYDFSVDAGDASKTSSLIAIDPNSTVILPNTASFQDASASINFTEDHQAYLTYEYAGQTVGSASITLSEIEEDHFSFSETESGETTPASGPKFIVINLKIAAIVLLTIFVLILLFLFFCRMYQRNRAKIRKAIAVSKKRRFSTRKRRRRKHKDRW